MAYERQQIVDLLRHLGYPQAAEDAARVLGDHVSMEEVAEFGNRHGISRDELVNRMGGSL